MKPWLLKLHRWCALAFALPLLAVLVSALLLSVEPWLTTAAIVPGSLTAETVQRLIERHDPQQRARAVFYRSYDNTLSIGASRSGGITVDVATGEALAGPGWLATMLSTMRGLHEKLLLDAGWLVLASTVALLVLALLGVLMGVPRITNTLRGWHKLVAWGLLPLLVLSPLTGLLVAGNVSFTAAPASAPATAPSLSLPDALRVVGATHDLSTLVWLRPRGGRMMARLVEDGEYRIYVVSASGVTALPRNWPRIWHEGNFAGRWSSLMNLLISVATLMLLVTGGWIWLRGRRRMWRARAARMGGRQVD